MNDLIRLMELAGLKDAARSNQKLNELGIPGFGGKSFGSVKVKFNWTVINGIDTMDATLTSKTSGATYDFHCSPSSRIANGSPAISFSKNVRSNDNGKEENPQDFTNAVSYLMNQYVKKGYEITNPVISTELPFFGPAEQVIMSMVRN